MILQFKTQSVKLRKKSYIEFTQENLMKFLLQTNLSYILQTMVCAYTTTNVYALSIILTYWSYTIILSVPKPFITLSPK